MKPKIQTKRQLKTAIFSVAWSLFWTKRGAVSICPMTTNSERTNSPTFSLKRIAKIAELEQHQLQELEEIAETQRKLSHKTNINVVSELFAGAELRIGEQTKLIREDQDKVTFHLVTEDDVEGIQMDTLSGNLRLS